jgi:HSP20 family protein
MSEWEEYKGWKQYAQNLLGDDFFWDFKGLLKDKGPLINIYESANEILCLISIPGLKNLNDIDIYVNHNTLKIQGIITYKYKGFLPIQEELFEGGFNRAIQLPYPVRDHPIDATYEKGLLIVHLHRLIERNRKKSKINIKELED